MPTHLYWCDTCEAYFMTKSAPTKEQKRGRHTAFSDSALLVSCPYNGIILDHRVEYVGKVALTLG